MNQLITFDSAELLVAHRVDVSKLPLNEQIYKIFDLAALTLKEEGLTMDDIIFIIAEMVDMRDRPIINEAQKIVWTQPEHFPCRIILQRGGFKAGAGLRLMFTATKALINKSVHPKDRYLPVHLPVALLSGTGFTARA
jgi:hypothetical protein